MSIIRYVSRFLRERERERKKEGWLLTENDLAVRRELRRKGFTEGTESAIIGHDSSVISPKVVGIEDGITALSGDVCRDLVTINIMGPSFQPASRGK